MHKEAIDIDNPKKGRFQVAMRVMTKHITDFESFCTFVKENRDSMRSWSDEKKDAFLTRIEELRKENPEFKEKYDVYEANRQEKIKKIKRAIPLDRQEEAKKKIIIKKAQNRLKQIQSSAKEKTTPKKSSGIKIKTFARTPEI